MITSHSSTVPRLARRMREHQLEALTDQIFRLITEAMPEYLSATSISAAELREANYRNLDQMLLALLGEDPHGTRWTALHETGQRRAQQRVPMESVLHSFRLGGRVLWEGLVREATLTGDADDLSRLLNDAVVVWDVIDRSSGVVTRAYREEQARVQRRTQRRREMILTELLEGRTLTPVMMAEAGDALGVPLNAPVLVVTSVTARTGPDPVPAAEAALVMAGFPCAWVSRGNRDSGVVALRDRDQADAVLALLTDVLPGPVVTSPVVTGFDKVGAAHRLAALALRTLPDDHLGLVRSVDRLPQALMAGSPDVAEVIAHHYLDGVLQLRVAEREMYLATIEAVVQANGSYAAASRMLYCHRNTVIKRLHRLEGLTGLSCTDPGVLFDLYLAVLAVRLRADQQPFGEATARPPGQRARS